MEPGWAGTVDSVDSLAALSTDAAFSGIAAVVAFLHSARFVRISRCGWIADATVGLSVLAVSAGAARRLTDGRHDRRNAEQVRLTDKVRKTDASVGSLVATSADTTGDAFASFLTATRDANLRLLAGNGRRADVRQTGASCKRVSVVSFKTGASGG